MRKRFVSIWFRQLIPDWFVLRNPSLKTIPFVVSAATHGRMVVVAANTFAEKEGVFPGMVLADARAIIPGLEVLEEIPDLPVKLLTKLADWCIRFSPIVAIDAPAGLLLNASGCAHLWGGEQEYVADICSRLQQRGYTIRVCMADTVGSAWAAARFTIDKSVIPAGDTETLLRLPALSLRLHEETSDRLFKLGLSTINSFAAMPRSALRRRFGPHLLQQLNKALGYEEETIEPVHPIETFQERLPCLEPISTATGIEIALEKLLAGLCHRLRNEQKGLRLTSFTCYCIDGRIEKIETGTNRPSNNPKHLFRLLEDKIANIEPKMGIELFVLTAHKVEDHVPVQEKIWETTGGLDDIRLSELLDRLETKTGGHTIQRFIPAEHHWPERAIKPAGSITEIAASQWKAGPPRPIVLLIHPEKITVTSPVPDYPPMLFRYKDKLHKIAKADGPERIEQEWWLKEGEHRDYYTVEDEEGHRYWLFRLGHYDPKPSYQWFLHGFFFLII